MCRNDRIKLDMKCMSRIITLALRLTIASHPLFHELTFFSHDLLFGNDSTIPYGDRIKKNMSIFILSLERSRKHAMAVIIGSCVSGPLTLHVEP